MRRKFANSTEFLSFYTLKQKLKPGLVGQLRPKPDGSGLLKSD